MPDTNTETVAEHALALYFAVKRDVVSLHEWTMRGKQWAKEGTGILGMNTWEGGGARGCKSEVVGVVGGGKIGIAISNLCQALGMKVLISERKSIPQAQARTGRTAFSEILTQCTTIILSCPLSSETKNLISAAELSLMRRDAILVNVARGGVVNEADLARALDAGEILGAATDVFEREPVEKGESPLVRAKGEERVRNLIVSPHVAWFGRDSQEKCVRAIAEIFEGYLKGEKINFVV
ncbi:putative glycerate dehydrogenase protein [Botrytis cinerea BcDW1]|nr:putative glycerate dehydrogenase protein [Botrytis cinerea BcDW1]